MFKIVNKQNLSAQLRRIDIVAADIVASIRPGQFVMIRPEEDSEKIPLSVVEWDNNRRSIALVFEVKGKDTQALEELPINEAVYSILGPLGRPATIIKAGTVVCLGVGIEVAALLPIARGFHQLNNKVIAVIGAKTKSELPLHPQMRVSSKKIYVTTEDGSFERRGSVLSSLKEVLSKEKVDLVYAIAPVDVMQNVSEMTKEKMIKTFVQLKPMMLDGTGFCGSCRVKVAGEPALACLQGLEFDGHQVDFEDLKIRLNAFQGLEECLSPQRLAGQKQNEGIASKRFLSAILEK